MKLKLSYNPTGKLNICSRKKNNIFFVFSSVFGFLLIGCNEKQADFDFIFHRTCIISNTEVNNLQEGQHFHLTSINENEIVVDNNLSDKLFDDKWYLGWGNHTNYYNAGVENLLSIKRVELGKNILLCDKPAHVKNDLNLGEEIIFLNAEPSGFRQYNYDNCIDPKWWSSFPTSSAGFSNIVYDSNSHHWVMIVNSYDGINYSFLAKSENLVEWQALSNFIFIDTAIFTNLAWAGYNAKGKKNGSALVSQVLYENNMWYVFFDSWGANGKRTIGVLAKKELTDTELVMAPVQVINTGAMFSWDRHSCFFGKIIKHGSSYIMFYDGKSTKGTENVGMATSSDLVHWQKYSGNPVIAHHSGWRSAGYTSEPVYVSQSNDSIFLVITGAKGWNENVICRFIKRDCYMRQKGNVDDIQWGVYVSTDGGKSFTPNANNPVFINDYAHNQENGHMGASMEYIKTDTLEFLFYQAKTDFNGSRYNIRLRVR